jgi:hypothetical protein
MSITTEVAFETDKEFEVVDGKLEEKEMGNARHGGVGARHDLWEKVNRKIYDYFAAGVRQVWLISLELRTISIYRTPTLVTILTEDDELTCEELLPGFSCLISEIFKQPARSQPTE